MATARASWKAGRGMYSLQIEVKQRGENLKAEAARALELSVEEGAIETQDLLEKATTPTGDRRAERGGFPGRHDTGNMVGSISYGLQNARAKIMWGFFGWAKGDFERYMRDQDLGEGNIPAARALPQAYIRARENLRKRMVAIVHGKPMR